MRRLRAKTNRQMYVGATHLVIRCMRQYPADMVDIIKLMFEEGYR